MSIPYVVDGETDLDSTTINRWIDNINTVPLASITGALGGYGPLANMRAGRRALLDVLPTSPDLTGETDYSEELIDQITDLANAGGGSIVLPPGRIGISQDVEVLSGVDLIGPGAAGRDDIVPSPTKIVALDAAAKVSFGGRGTGSWGFHSGGFLLDGNDLSPQMLYVGRTMSRTFAGIWVQNCAGGASAVLIEEAQNNLFQTLDISGNGGTGLEMTAGAAGNVFLKAELTGNGTDSAGSHIAFTEAGYTPSSLLTYASNNVFYGAIIERNTAGNLTSYIYQGAGLDNRFSECAIASHGGSDGATLILIERSGSAQSQRLTFHSCGITGNNGSGVTLISLDDASTLVFTGYNVLTYAPNGYYLNDLSSLIQVQGAIAYNGITNLVHPSSTGSLDRNMQVDFRNVLVHRPVATSNDVFRVYVQGESGYRFRLGGDGKLYWMDGSSFTLDTNLYRGGADLLKTDDGFALAGTYDKPLMLGSYRLWVNPGDGKLYIKSSAPSSATDGTVVGSQS